MHRTLLTDKRQCLEVCKMIKILVFRNRKTGQITCIQDCPNYDDLDIIVNEFNTKDPECIVTAEKIKEGSLTEFLLKTYKSHKTTTKNDIDECLRALDFGFKRLNLQIDFIKQEMQALSAQKYTQI